MPNEAENGSVKIEVSQKRLTAQGNQTEYYLFCKGDPKMYHPEGIENINYIAITQKRVTAQVWIC